jgi:hypothetical protein
MIFAIVQIASLKAVIRKALLIICSANLFFFLTHPFSRKQDGLRKLKMTFSAINVKRPHENAGSMAKFLVMV